MNERMTNFIINNSTYGMLTCDETYMTEHVLITPGRSVTGRYGAMTAIGHNHETVEYEPKIPRCYNSNSYYLDGLKVVMDPYKEYIMEFRDFMRLFGPRSIVDVLKDYDDDTVDKAYRKCIGRG